MDQELLKDYFKKKLILINHCYYNKNNNLVFCFENLVKNNNKILETKINTSFFNFYNSKLNKFRKHLILLKTKNYDLEKKEVSLEVEKIYLPKNVLNVLTLNRKVEEYIFKNNNIRVKITVILKEDLKNIESKELYLDLIRSLENRIKRNEIKEDLIYNLSEIDFKYFLKNKKIKNKVKDIFINNILFY